MVAKIFRQRHRTVGKLVKICIFCQASRGWSPAALLNINGRIYSMLLDTRFRLSARANNSGFYSTARLPTSSMIDIHFMSRMSGMNSD